MAQVLTSLWCCSPFAVSSSACYQTPAYLTL
jgi:hypothetical protein